MQRLGIINRLVFLRRFSSTFPGKEQRVVMTDDDSTIVCWHPEEFHPYECSLPIPKAAPLEESVFNVQATKNLALLRKAKKPQAMRQELMNLTSTAHYLWYPCNRIYRQKKHYPFPRPYL